MSMQLVMSSVLVCALCLEIQMAESSKYPPPSPAGGPGHGVGVIAQSGFAQSGFAKGFGSRSAWKFSQQRLGEWGFQLLGNGTCPCPFVDES